MRLHVVSDVHGSADALKRAGEGADAVVCLGDLVLFLDYDDPGQGIFADLFGAEHAARWIALRTEQRFDEARAYSSELWGGLGGNPWTHVENRVRAQYSELFAALMTPAYLTYGNVDVPHLWPEFLREGHHLLDGESTVIGGARFGFVGGGLRTPYRTPFEVSDEEFAAKVAGAFADGPLDVLCCHIPPSVPELTYDTVARRFERGSEAVLEAIREYRPPLVLFGHVHQPLASRMRIGSTECVNVGHFRGSGRPYVLNL